MKKLLCLLAVMAGLIPTFGHADDRVHYGALSCEDNRALIRFAEAFNEDAPVFPDIPSEVGLFQSKTDVDLNVRTKGFAHDRAPFCFDRNQTEAPPRSARFNASKKITDRGTA